MKPIFDNLDLLLGENEREDDRRRGGGQPSYQALLDQGILEVEPDPYLVVRCRGSTCGRRSNQLPRGQDGAHTCR